MFNQKGNIPIILLLIIILVAGIGFYIIKSTNSANTIMPEQSVGYYNPTSVPYYPSPSPTPGPDLPILDKQDPTNFVIAKYVNRGGVFNAEPKGEIVIKMPQDAKITNQQLSSVTGYGVLADVQFGDKTYTFQSSANPHGLCGSDAIVNPDCSYTDDGIYRIWEDKKGIFTISLSGLTVGDYSSGVIIIGKTKPNFDFSQTEIDQWKSIINSAKVYESEPFQFCVLNNSCK